MIKAFRGETMANQKYTNYASIATSEGHMMIADVFKETARNENQHARRIANFLTCNGFTAEEICDYVKYPIYYSNTLENLKEAATGESDENQETYPYYAKVAFYEGYPEIGKLFNMISSVEKRHENQYAKLAEQLENNSLYKSNELTDWKCHRCGYIYTNYEPPVLCPLCNKEKTYFEEYTKL